MNPIRAMSRNERQHQLNTKLSVLPAFSPLNDYQVYHINRATSAMLLPDLIQCARRTTRFSIDTEHDYYTHQAALIQIEFIQDKSVVILIETCHLPHASSVLFWLIRSLLKVVFKSSNTIYAWGDAIHELSDFIQYDLFSSQTLYQMNTIDVQHDFKKWYNKTFFHYCGLPPPFYDNNVKCTCLHRSVKNPNNQWSLQNAVSYAFDQFLDKSRTKSRWSRPLDIAYVQERFGLNDRQKSNLEHLIRYAVNDCLAVTKILVFLEDHNIFQRIHLLTKTMYHWSQQQQEEDFIDDYDLILKNIDLLAVPFNQSHSLLTINEDTAAEKEYDQQLQHTNVVVNLYDCMKCCVRVKRCEIEENEHCSNTSTQIQVEQQLPELQPEGETDKENGLQKQLNETMSYEEETDEQLYFQWLDREAYLSTKQNSSSPQQQFPQ